MNDTSNNPVRLSSQSGTLLKTPSSPVSGREFIINNNNIPNSTIVESTNNDNTILWILLIVGILISVGVFLCRNINKSKINVTYNSDNNIIASSNETFENNMQYDNDPEFENDVHNKYIVEYRKNGNFGPIWK
jgi:hypothetical protein